MSFKTISVVGLGYIGLPTAAVFASHKINVIGVDINQNAVDTINRGEIHIVEPDLDAVVRAAVSDGYLRATTVPEPADAFLIAVPTPFKKGAVNENEPDLAYIELASKSIAPVLKKGDLVILESTSPVGATEQMAAWMAEARPDLSFPQTNGEGSDIRVAHCPERVLPGQVIRELVENDRVIGGMTSKCSDAACSLYRTFVKGECVVTNARTAEMCKLTENSFRDVNIAFANELSIICDKLDINVWELIRLANRHPRVNILQPGPGVGGHCIAVDPWFIVSKTPEDAKIIKTARTVNDLKPEWVIDKVENTAKQIIKNGTVNTKKDLDVICYGLTFKADIDDLRESPALNIAFQLQNAGYKKTYIVEPNIDVLPREFKSSTLIGLESSLLMEEAIHVLLVDHRSFKEVKPAMKYLVDTKGVWDS